MNDSLFLYLRNMNGERFKQSVYRYGLIGR
jgi:hypothetical protein